VRSSSSGPQHTARKCRARSDTWRILMQCAFPGPTATRCCSCWVYSPVPAKRSVRCTQYRRYGCSDDGECCSEQCCGISHSTCCCVFVFRDSVRSGVEEATAATTRQIYAFHVPVRRRCDSTKCQWNPLPVSLRQRPNEAAAGPGHRFTNRS